MASVQHNCMSYVHFRGIVFIFYLSRFPLKADVEKRNLKCLGELPGEKVVYKAMDARGHDIYGDRLGVNQAEKLLEKHVCPKEVPLKVGAQVMLLRVCFVLLLHLVPSHFRQPRTCYKGCSSTDH